MSDDVWQFATSALPGDDWTDSERVMLVIDAHGNETTGHNQHRLEGIVAASDDGSFIANWVPFASPTEPTAIGDGIYRTYIGATLTAKAFDSVAPGLGKWLVSLAAWLFAVSTIISWSYYGEQGIVYLAGEKSVFTYKLIYCLLIVISTLGFIQTDADLDNMTGVGTAVMLFANIPICWFFGYQAMAAYKEYVQRLKRGQI